MRLAAPERGKPMFGKGRLQIADIVVPQCEIGGEVSRARQIFHTAGIPRPALQCIAAFVLDGPTQMHDTIQKFMNGEAFHCNDLEI